MSIELESVEDIKTRMTANSKEETVNKNIDVKEEIREEKSERKAPLRERLEKSYQGLNDTEKQAWSQGWRPEEFFVGKNKDGSDKKFINAEDFLNKSKDALPVANERLKELAKELEETKKIAKEAQERIFKAEEKGYQKALAEIELKQKQAVELGDVEEFSKLKEEEKNLINTKFTKEVSQNETVQEKVVEQTMTNTQPTQSILSPYDQQILQNWVSKNSWMKTDERLAAYAIASEKKLLNEKPYLSLNERLELVEEEVKEVFYNKFQTEKHSPILFESSNGGFGNSTPKEKTYSNLPESIKNQCETLIKIRGITGEDNIKRFKQTFAKSIN